MHGSGFGLAEIATVGKAVRRHIDDAHEPGAVERNARYRRTGRRKIAEQAANMRFGAGAYVTRGGKAPRGKSGGAFDHLKSQTADRAAGDRQGRTLRAGLHRRISPYKPCRAEIEFSAQSAAPGLSVSCGEHGQKPGVRQGWLVTSGTAKKLE